MDKINFSNTVKQPPPCTSETDCGSNRVQGEIQQKFNRPRVGTVKPPVISRTPLVDTMEMKKLEIPQTKYQYVPKEKTKNHFQKFASIGVAVLGIASIFSNILKHGK